MQKSQCRALLSLCVIGVLIGTRDAATAHHSLAAFDIVSSIELEATVLEFRFTSPHSYIVVRAKGTDGRVATWTLEGIAATSLAREGWTNKTLKPGDQIRASISRLLSGGAGGSWTPQGIHFRDGKSVAAGR